MILVQSKMTVPKLFLQKTIYYEIRSRYFQNIQFRKIPFNSENECKKHIKSATVFKSYVMVYSV